MCVRNGVWLEPHQTNAPVQVNTVCFVLYLYLNKRGNASEKLKIATCVYAYLLHKNVVLWKLFFDRFMNVRPTVVGSKLFVRSLRFVVSIQYFIFWSVLCYYTMQQKRAWYIFNQILLCEGTIILAKVVISSVISRAASSSFFINSPIPA